jgi:cell division protein FtsW
MPRKLKPDAWILGTALALMAVGVLNVTSSAGIIIQGSTVGFITRQIVLALLCVGILFAFLRFDIRPLLRHPRFAWIYWAAVAALVLLFALPAYKDVHRFVRLGGFLLQPSEFAKIAAVVMVARLLAKHEYKEGLVPVGIHVGIPFFLILLEPDLGISGLLLVTVFAMVFLKGMPWKHVAALSAAGIVVLALAIALVGYRLERLQKFIAGTEEQTLYAKIALGSGGLLGKGIGGSHQKYFYLSKPHTDFAYAILGEEFGLVGTLAVLTAYGILFWRGMALARSLAGTAEGYTAFGLTVLLVTQALIHISVNVNLVPPKGITLPLISYGGSSLLATTLLLGVLLSLSMRRA